MGNPNTLTLSLNPKPLTLPPNPKTLSTLNLVHQPPIPLTPTPERRYKAEAQKQRKMIYALEKEREKYGQQASDATAKYLEVSSQPATLQGYLAHKKTPPPRTLQ